MRPSRGRNHFIVDLSGVEGAVQGSLLLRRQGLHPQVPGCAEQRSIQRSQSDSPACGQFQIRSIVGRQTLCSGKRQNLAECAAVRLGIGRDWQTVQEFELRRCLGRRKSFPPFRPCKDVADLQAPEPRDQRVAVLQPILQRIYRRRRLVLEQPGNRH